MVEIKFQRLHAKAALPSYATAGAACFDFQAAFDGEPITVEPGRVVAIPTGLACEIPPGYELQVRARSGLAFKHGFSLVNGIGTIDADYRGEIRVLVTVHAMEAFTVRSGDRIAQGIISPAPQARLVEAATLSETARGTGGFGSTGLAGKST